MVTTASYIASAVNPSYRPDGGTGTAFSASVRWVIWFHCTITAGSRATNCFAPLVPGIANVAATATSTPATTV